MKKLILGIALLGLTSCGPNGICQYADAPTQFIVTNVAQYDGMKEMCTYEIEVVDANGLSHGNANNGNNLIFRMCDSIGKYKVGQPIHFDKNR